VEDSAGNSGIASDCPGRGCLEYQHHCPQTDQPCNERHAHRRRPSLEAIDIGLLAGRVELNGLTVNPPKDHGTDPLLSMGNLVLDVVPTSLLSDVIVVEEVTLKGMSINLVRDKQGRLGLDKLVKAEKPAAEKPDAAAKEKTLPVVQVNKIRLEDGSITVRDSALTGKPMVFPLTNIHVAVDQLRLFDENKAAIQRRCRSLSN
jgi:uncharacterized protein involved in outer membrane biogenesis